MHAAPRARRGGRLARRRRGGRGRSGEPRPLLYAGYAQRWFRDAANFRSPRASEWASEASRTARAVLDRHGADAYVHALEERLGSEAVADVRLDEETAALRLDGHAVVALLHAVVALEALLQPRLDPLPPSMR